MCGIAGVFFTKRQRLPIETAMAMAKSLSHRGPDYQGAWAGEGVLLAHARLSILDLSAFGNQPMTSLCGRYTIVFNGEIYNYRELRANLVTLGETFRSNSDTEVLLRCFARDGLACLRSLNGIFGFAVWDAIESRLTLARDRFGIKPLYYALHNGSLWFGSEIKAMRAGGAGPFSFRRNRLPEYLYYGVVSDNATLFAEVERVQPGGYITVDASAGVTKGRYWCPEDVPVQHSTSQEAIVRTRSLLEQAVRRQLVADVPVGVFLSGGIDSSSIATFASRNYPGRLRTYSVGFDFNRGINELPRASRTAKLLGTEHTELHIRGNDLQEVIQDLVWHHDEPFAEGANIPLFLLCRELRGQTKVVLQGDGGDELFGGYRRYKLLRRARLWRVACRSALALKVPMPWRLSRMAQALGADDDGLRMALLMSLEVAKPDPLRVLTPHLRKELEGEDPFFRHRELNQRFANAEPVQRMLLSDTQALLPDLYLEKVDKSTMAFGIEARVPFLDNDLADFALGLPAVLKMQGGEAKFLLRRALRGIISDEVLDGPKTGFSVPYVNWIRGPLYSFARETILDAASGPNPWFDELILSKLLDELRRYGTNGFLLWKCLHLALWRRQQKL